MRTAELPTLPEARAIYRAAHLPGTAFSLLMELSSQVVLLEEAAAEVVFRLAASATATAAEWRSQNLIEVFEFAGWELLSVDYAPVRRGGRA